MPTLRLSSCSSLHEFNQVDRLAVAVQASLDERDVLQCTKRGAEAIVLAVDGLEEAAQLEFYTNRLLLYDLLLLAHIASMLILSDREDGDAEVAAVVHVHALDGDPAVLASDGDATMRVLAARRHRGTPSELDEAVGTVLCAHDGVDSVVGWEMLLVLRCKS